MKAVVLFVLVVSLVARGYASDLVEERPEKERGLLEAEQPEQEQPWNLGDWFKGRRVSLPSLPNVDQLENRLGSLWSRIFGRGKAGSGSQEEEVQSSFSGLGSGMRWSELEEMFTPWWKGPNVCKREELLEDDEEQEAGNGLSSLIGSMLATSCTDNGVVYKCEMSVRKEGKTVRRRLLRECCHGWARRPGQPGCPQELSLDGLLETLQKSNLTDLVGALEATGLDERLGSGNWTLMAPSNEALSSLTEQPIEVVTLRKGRGEDLPRQMLLGHMVEGWRPRHSWQDEGLLPSADGASQLRTNFFRDHGGRQMTTVNCARVLGQEVRSHGGLVNVVDRLLMPAKKTLWELVSEDERFSTMAALASEEDRRLLSDPDAHHTLFAFTDDAVDALPEAQRQALRDGQGCWAGIVRDLILPHSICSVALTRPTTFLRTIGGHLLNATNDGEELVVEGAAVSERDRMGTNGVLQVVGGVPRLAHRHSGLDAAARRGRSAFALAARRAGLQPDLDEQKHVTMFVPPNDKLEAAMEDMDEDEKRSFIQNHMASNLVEVSGKNRETLVETLAGTTLNVRVTPVSFFGLSAKVGCARVTEANVGACGATLHLVDRPLALPEGNLMEVARGREDLSEMVTLLELAGLDQRLESDDFSGTLLAVPNAALDDALGDEKEELVNDGKRLRAFLERHVLREAVCCDSFGRGFPGRRGRTLSGSSLRLRAGRPATAGGVAVLSCDGAATNGLLHVLEAPLPQPRPRPSVRDLFRSDDFRWPF